MDAYEHMLGSPYEADQPRGKSSDAMKAKLAEVNRRLAYADQPRKVAELQRMKKNLEVALGIEF